MVTFKSLFSMMLRHKRSLVWGNAIALAATLVSIPIPLLIPLLVDEVLLKKGGWVTDTINRFSGWNEPLLYIGIVLAVTIALRFLFFILSVASQRFFITLSQELSFGIRRRALEHLKKVSMSAYERLGSGQVVTNLVTDIETIEQFLGNALAKFVVSVTTLIGVAVVLIWINPLFGILILIFQPLIMVVTRKISGRVGKLKKEQNRMIGELSDTLTQMCDLFGQIRSSNKEERFIARSIMQAHALKESATAYGTKALAGERYSYTLFLSGFEVFRALGLVMVLHSDLSIGMMFGVFGYLWFMMTPVQELLSLQYGYANAKNALARVNELLSLPKEPEYPTHSDPFTTSAQGVAIRTESLVFGYDPDQPILRGIDLNIPQGGKVAIIGASGSGKSTLAQLLVGFYPPTSGDIVYNGMSVRQIGFSRIRENVFVVLQQPLMFNDTLRFNLTMGDEVDDETVWKALEIAQLASFVRTLPQALETQVGKFGIRLSGGQRQRLSIARMVLANPKAVIFDESTSALDVHTESALFAALEEFLKERTVIIIAHRLSTITQADYIYVLENGSILEEGTARELERLDGNFKRFVDRQH
ncbi:MAG: ABC transporter ATP-binding protein [Sulfuricurvum sp. MLSB]|uniref:ABC transporter ATP-binding protein n=1 Tax=unclassified Sulfuricurvum TaxID=2632390 RepID=UPI000501BAC0|nr:MULTISPECIES: ABC transporter ATP-binding protein [unclassified Sulfuricurvum]KFN40311.1 MAG: ABC transporter ATP-binding protein [Sulfuricurvum sp. MLSB]